MSNDLFDAIEQHDIDGVTALLDAGADVNAGHHQCENWVPLKAAIEELVDGGPIDAVVLLLRRGAKVDGSGNPGDASPLIVAALNDRLDAVRILLEAGADPNVRDDEGDTALSLSRNHQNLKMESLLKSFGATE